MTGRLLVPVSESVSLRNTVAYVLREALADDGGPSTGTVHFVYALSERSPDDTERSEARELLDRIDAWVDEDLDDADQVTVETMIVGGDMYLFSPGDYADLFATHARDHDLDAVVFDPEYDPAGTIPLLPPLQGEIRRAGLDAVEAPTDRERRGTRLVSPGTASQFLLLFVASFGFYLLLAASIAPFELATGAISAGIVAAALWRVSLTGPVDAPRLAGQLARLLVYAPYLLVQIVRANLEIAYVVLHPDLPIDPEVVEFDAAVWSSVSVTALANSITLTPGTLTVDVNRRHFTVHALVPSAREDLLAGGLERGVRFVFYGLSAARIASPTERRNSDAPSDPAPRPEPDGGEES